MKQKDLMEKTPPLMRTLTYTNGREAKRGDTALVEIEEGKFVIGKIHGPVNKLGQMHLLYDGFAPLLNESFEPLRAWHMDDVVAALSTMPNVNLPLKPLTYTNGRVAKNIDTVLVKTKKGKFIVGEIAGPCAGPKRDEWILFYSDSLYPLGYSFEPFRAWHMDDVLAALSTLPPRD
jgi:hypothetical protein